MCVRCLVVSDFLQPHRLAHQAPPSMGFSRQEHWSGLPFPSPKGSIERKKVKSLNFVWLFVTPWSLPSSSIYGIFQARVLVWVAISFSILVYKPHLWLWITCYHMVFLLWPSIHERLESSWHPGLFRGHLLCQSRGYTRVSHTYLHIFLSTYPGYSWQ